MKLLLSVLLATTISYASETQISKTEVLALINETAESTDAETLERMKLGLELVQSELNSGMIKMSSIDRKTTLITCTTGKAGFFIAGRIGLCLDTTGQVYTLAGTGQGFSFGAAASLLFGVVKSDGQVRGHYESITLGGAGVHSAINLGLTLKKLNIGLGLDVVYSKSSSGNTMVLFGPSLGSMIDFSQTVLTLD